MPNTLPVNNYALDGACVRIRFGRIAVTCIGIELPEESIKTELVRHLGEQVSQVRTLGMYEAKEATVNITSAVLARQILPRWPVHGGNAFEFVTTITQRHPLVGSPYSVILDRCRFIGIKPEKIEASEKPITIGLPISVINVFHKGEDGVWTSLASTGGQMSELAQIASEFLF